MPNVTRIADVHKVADYGNDLEPGPQRDHWRSIIKESFDFLLSYIGSPNGKIFKRLLSLSRELDMIIFMSYKRGKGANRDNYHEFGSKAWYLNTFAKSHPMKKFYLVDDGADHINSVNSLKNPNIIGILITYENKQGIDVYGTMSMYERERCIRRALDKIF